MNNDDINILFASCVAAVILIADFIATHRKQRQLISSDVHKVNEDKKEQIID